MWRSCTGRRRTTRALARVFVEWCASLATPRCSYAASRRAPAALFSPPRYPSKFVRGRIGPGGGCVRAASAARASEGARRGPAGAPPVRLCVHVQAIPPKAGKKARPPSKAASAHSAWRNASQARRRPRLVHAPAALHCLRLLKRLPRKTVRVRQSSGIGTPNKRTISCRMKPWLGHAKGRTACTMASAACLFAGEAMQRVSLREGRGRAMQAAQTRLQRQVLLPHQEGEQHCDAARAAREAVHQHAAARRERFAHESKAGVEVRAQLGFGTVVHLVLRRALTRRALAALRRLARGAARCERLRAEVAGAAATTRLDSVIPEVGGEGARQTNRHAQHVSDAGGQQPLAVMRRLRRAASAAAWWRTAEGGCAQHARATHPDAAHEQALRHAHRLPVLLQLAHWRGAASGAASGKAVSPGGAAARGSAWPGAERGAAHAHARTRGQHFHQRHDALNLRLRRRRHPRPTGRRPEPTLRPAAHRSTHAARSALLRPLRSLLLVRGGARREEGGLQVLLKPPRQLSAELHLGPHRSGLTQKRPSRMAAHAHRGRLIAACPKHAAPRQRDGKLTNAALSYCTAAKSPPRRRLIQTVSCAVV